MTAKTPARVVRKQQLRDADARRQHDEYRATVETRTPDWWTEEQGIYPPRAARRARKPRHAATGTVTERQNRSNATPAKTARARRVRAARRATRYARRAGVAA